MKLKVDFRLLRTLSLIALLLVEVALILSLRTLGWFATGGTIRWIAGLIVTILPLGIAAMLLVWIRWRFSLRTLLVSITFFAIFLCISVTPLIDFHASRNVSKKLMAEKSTLYTKSTSDDFYLELKYDPRLTSRTKRVAELPPWLQPLVGNASLTPVDNSVREVWLNTDEQIRILCQDPSRFESLERIAISPGAFGTSPRITQDGLALLKKTLPRFQQLNDMHISSMPVPENWFASLRNVRVLWVWAEGPMSGSAMTANDLQDIAALPDLQLLLLLGYGVTDSEAMLLADSKSLKRIFIRRSAMTASGEAALAVAMPACVIQRD